ncbi:MAG: hypothetical protein K2L03_00180 [Bacteroidales bacterium]|nr:hypothetical protein [Bacteroidales bacterium]
MKKSFACGLVVLTLAISLCSCRVGCETRNWQGGKAIPAEGGTVVWRPTLDVNVQVIPDIREVGFGFYDSNYNWISFAQLDADSVKIKGEGYEKITGEWFEVLASTNVVVVTFSANDTSSNERVLEALISDGGYELGPDVRVTQAPLTKLR